MEVVMDYGRYQEDSDLAGIKWLLPTAPVRAITVNGGERLNGACLLRAHKSARGKQHATRARMWMTMHG